MSQLNLFSSNFQVLITDNTRTDDNWVNATKWCEHFGKQWKDIVKQPNFKKFLKILQEKLPNGTGDKKSLVNSVNKGRAGSETWVHPLVAIKLAEWLSPEFDVFVKETFKRFLGNDPELISEMIGRTTDRKSLKKIKASLESQEEYLGTYHQLHDTIKSHGGISATHAIVNSNNTHSINLETTGDRSHWSTEQKVAVSFLQLLQSKGVEKDRVNGHKEIVDKCVDLADSIKPALISILG